MLTIFNPRAFRWRMHFSHRHRRTQPRQVAATQMVDEVRCTETNRTDMGVYCFSFRETVGLRTSVERDAVAFGVFELGDETVFADAGFGQQRLAAVGVDPCQRPLNVGRREVD